jgi:hypothetical protein
MVDALDGDFAHAALPVPPEKVGSPAQKKKGPVS